LGQLPAAQAVDGGGAGFIRLLGQGVAADAGQRFAVQVTFETIVTAIAVIGGDTAAIGETAANADIGRIDGVRSAALDRLVRDRAKAVAEVAVAAEFLQRPAFAAEAGDVVGAAAVGADAQAVVAAIAVAVLGLAVAVDLGRIVAGLPGLSARVEP